MAKGKFWSKITGAREYEEEFDNWEDDAEYAADYHDYSENDAKAESEHDFESRASAIESSEEIDKGYSKHLPVDIYQDEENIYIEAFVPAVDLSDIDIHLARDMIQISGTRKKTHSADEANYFYKELYWGQFDRQIVLPEEIDIDNAEAFEKRGLLRVVLPKINKARKTKLKIKAER